MAKILIIEDEKALADMYKIELERRGFEAIVAFEGEEGIEIAKKEKPDLIVLDLLLPRIQGIEALKILKQNSETKDIPVFILTNYDTFEQRANGENLGAEKYILKTSITPQKVADLIEERLKK
ncbi:MAG TPA: response regulator [Candidatus Pacearchaeota archaeon]|nr:response regulator [Candidatus Pacearchaeota archaeon]HOK94401.1 response regulator [Candidatus Pacearchaeota archaeon]HPO75474.1 response regulator [Candidatus Pacearchaeota archaeon]